MFHVSARRLAAGLVLAATLAACGGGGAGAAPVGQASASDPAATVNSLIATIQNKAFDKLPDLACAAQKDSISGSFSGGLGDASAMGVQMSDILAAVNFEMSNVSVGSPAVSGDTATVPLKAQMKITLNKDKFKEVLKKIMAASGQTVSDALVDAAMAQAGPALEKSQSIDTTVPLSKENGKWLICGDITKLGG
jgi:hypothetical protein